jgi:hypothetical protein
MSREEDLIRSTTHAIASTVREVPPLRLEPAAGELQSPARAPRRPRGGNGRQRRWWSWGAPLTAAAVVVALAIALVVIKDIPNGGAVSPSPTASTGPGGAPRYYVAITTFSGSVQIVAGKEKDTVRNGIVVGDSVTGARLAKIPAPADVTFVSVTAAADDRTFVVFALTSSTGSLGLPQKGATLTGRWYEVRLAPGTANPARLSPLPITPWSWAGQDSSAPSAGEVYDTALSASGQELAVADVPDLPAADKPWNWQEVKVFSVATGRLLYDWTEDAPNDEIVGVLSGTINGILVGPSNLTWIDGDHALTLATSSHNVAGTVTGTVRRLNLAGPARGDMKAAGSVIWSGKLTWNDGYGCYAAGEWPPLISADGKTATCLNYAEVKSAPAGWMASFVTDPLPPGTAAGLKPRFDYQVTSPVDQNGKPLAGGADTSLLWASPSGDTIIGVWHYIASRAPATGVHFGVIRGGTFTPLRLPNSLANDELGQIAF